MSLSFAFLDFISDPVSSLYFHSVPHSLLWTPSSPYPSLELPLSPSLLQDLLFTLQLQLNPRSPLWTLHVPQSTQHISNIPSSVSSCLWGGHYYGPVGAKLTFSLLMLRPLPITGHVSSATTLLPVLQLKPLTFYCFLVLSFKIQAVVFLIQVLTIQHFFGPLVLATVLVCFLFFLAEMSSVSAPILLLFIASLRFPEQEVRLQSLPFPLCFTTTHHNHKNHYTRAHKSPCPGCKGHWHLTAHHLNPHCVSQLTRAFQFCF